MKTNHNPPAELTISKPELMVNGQDVAFRTFLHDFLAFSARVNQIRARFGEIIGITGTAYTTLISIAFLQAEGDDEELGVGVNRVAQHLHLSGAFVTLEVAKLVAAGLVRKRTNMKDRRRVLLTITAKGRKALNDLAPIQRPVNDALFDSLDKADFKQMKEQMAQLVSCGERALALLEFMIRDKAAAGGER